MNGNHLSPYGESVKHTKIQTEIISPSPAKDRIRLFALLLFLLIAAVYGTTLYSFYPNLPIIERLPEDIPGFDAQYPPFRVDENTYYTISEHILQGSLYKESDSPERGFPLGFPLVAAPFIALFGKAGGYIANTLIVLGSLLLFYLLLRRFGFRWRALALTLVMAFASLDWFYAVSNYSEPLSQLLVIGALFLLLGKGESRGQSIALVAAGGVLALNLFVRPNYILLAAPFFLYLCFREDGKFAFSRQAILFTAGTAGVIAVWMVRNALVFGSPFSFEYTRLVGSFAPGMQSQYMKGNIFLGLHRLLFDEYHGLLTITPICLLLPAGLRVMWLKGMRRESLMVLASVVIMILFVASGPYPFTEFGLGSRHLAPIFPLLLFPVAFFLDGKIFPVSIVTAAAMYSFYMAGIGWFTGGEPGMGFFLGILNDAQSRAVVLARKGLLPRKHFSSEKDLTDSYLKALKTANLTRLLQTMDPLVIEKIRGNERNFMIFLRSQPNPEDAILTANPERGIIIKSFSVNNGLQETPTPPDSTKTQ